MYLDDSDKLELAVASSVVYIATIVDSLSEPSRRGQAIIVIELCVASPPPGRLPGKRLYSLLFLAADRNPTSQKIDDIYKHRWHLHPRERLCFPECEPLPDGEDSSRP